MKPRNREKVKTCRLGKKVDDIRLLTYCLRIDEEGGLENGKMEIFGRDIMFIIRSGWL